VQTARALLKIVAAFKKTNTEPPMLSCLAELDRPAATTRSSIATPEWRDPAVYVRAFERRFLHLLRAFLSAIADAPSVAVGVQRHSIDCFKLSNAYASLLLVKTFADAVHSRNFALGSGESLTLATATLEALRSLCHLFALSQLEREAGEFMESGAIAPSDMPLVRATVKALLLELRPHAVALVDGFNFSDRTLNSALGRFDGKVYEALFETTKLDPVNKVADGGAVALRELLLPIREEVARLEGEQRARL